MAEEQETSTTEEKTESQTSDKSTTESDDLDAILSEYEDSTESEDKPEEKSNGESKEDDEIKQWIRQQQAKEANQEATKTVTEAVERMKKRDGLKNVPDTVLTDILWGKAGQNSRIRVAYAQRHSNPSGWNKVVDALGKDLEKAFGSLPDRNLTEDYEATRAAVTSASNRDPQPDGPSPEQVNKMTDKEFFDKFGNQGPF